MVFTIVAYTIDYAYDIPMLRPRATRHVVVVITENDLINSSLYVPTHEAPDLQGLDPAAIEGQL